MSKVTDKNSQLVRWLNRLFPPSAPRYTQPEEVDELLHLFLNALPPSLLYERTGIQFGFTINPATQLFFPSVEGGLEGFGATQLGVPPGKFYWIIAARFSAVTQAGTNLGRAFIALKNIAAADELGFAQGFFSNTASFGTEFLDTRAPQTTQTGAAVTAIQGGGALSPFAVPPGYCIHMSTTQIPAAATLYRGVVHYCVCDIGELHP